VEVVGNSFSGNRSLDDRETKFTFSPVVFDSGAPTYNRVTENWAKGAMPGTPAFLNNSTGTNNIVANNIDG
jgi:hypothetical protein